MLMCRNIKILFNYEPPATEDEIRAASLQYIRKVSGFTKPSKVNKESFQTAVYEIALATSKLLNALETSATSKNRAEEAAKARARAARRFSE